MLSEADGDTFGPAAGGGGNNIPIPPPPILVLGLDGPSLPSFCKYGKLKSDRENDETFFYP